MTFEEARDRILELMRDRGGNPLTATELARLMDLRGKSRKCIQKWLVRLSRGGELTYLKPNRYSLPPPERLVTGKLTVLRSGHGIVVDPETLSEVFILEKDVARALPGDVVVVRISPASSPDQSRPRSRDRGGLTGVIVRILERSHRDIVGTIRMAGRSLFAVPIDPGVRCMFRVIESHGVRVNDRVVIRFSGWDSRSDSPDADILEVLGAAADPSTDTLAILRHYGFPTEFPDEVLREAEAAVEMASCPGERKDLRGGFVFTIDPATARDFDDAVSIDISPEGHRILGVHIADVSHFVRPGGALDREALARGNTVYLPDKVIPMLPECLSNGICSLRPNEDRLTVSVFLTFDKAGHVFRREFARTIIRSALRLTYEQAMAIIDGQEPDIPVSASQPTDPAQTQEALRRLHFLAQQCRAERFAQYALDMDIPECEVFFNEGKTVTDIRLVRSDPSHQLIEECMVAANEAVAFELESTGYSIISRLHDPPDDDKIEVLAATLADMGFSVRGLRQQRYLAEFLKKVKNQPLGPYVQTAVLRSLKRAIYSANARGHYGLAKPHYAHFTSPIRRYTDITLHRQLGLAMEHRAEWKGNGSSRAYERGELSVIARSCSMTEQMADEAERSLSDILKYRFLQAQLDAGKCRIYDAVIIDVVRFGVFVEVLDLQIRGLVHNSLLSRHMAASRSPRGRHRGRSAASASALRVGAKMKVTVSRVDVDRRQIDFVPAPGHSARP